MPSDRSDAPTVEVGVDDRKTLPKQGRSPIGGTMTKEERAKILAALAYANDQTHLFPKK